MAAYLRPSIHFGLCFGQIVKDAPVRDRDIIIRPNSIIIHIIKPVVITFPCPYHITSFIYGHNDSTYAFSFTERPPADFLPYLNIQPFSR